MAVIEMKMDLSAAVCAQTGTSFILIFRTCVECFHIDNSIHPFIIRESSLIVKKSIDPIPQSAAGRKNWINPKPKADSAGLHFHRNRNHLLKIYILNSASASMKPSSHSLHYASTPWYTKSSVLMLNPAWYDNLVGKPFSFEVDAAAGPKPTKQVKKACINPRTDRLLSAAVPIEIQFHERWKTHSTNVWRYTYLPTEQYRVPPSSSVHFQFVLAEIEYIFLWEWRYPVAAAAPLTWFLFFRTIHVPMAESVEGWEN